MTVQLLLVALTAAAAALYLARPLFRQGPPGAGCGGGCGCATPATRDNLVSGQDLTARLRQTSSGKMKMP